MSPISLLYRNSVVDVCRCAQNVGFKWHRKVAATTVVIDLSAHRQLPPTQIASFLCHCVHVLVCVKSEGIWTYKRMRFFQNGDKTLCPLDFVLSVKLGKKHVTHLRSTNGNEQTGGRPAGLLA